MFVCFLFRLDVDTLLFSQLLVLRQVCCQVLSRTIRRLYIYIYILYICIYIYIRSSPRHFKTAGSHRHIHQHLLGGTSHSNSHSHSNCNCNCTSDSNSNVEWHFLSNAACLYGLISCLRHYLSLVYTIYLHTILVYIIISSTCPILSSILV